MKKYLCELLGTAMLVLFGCGAAVLANVVMKGNINVGVGFLGIAFAFGLAIVAIAYSVGQISGGHVNPAVSLGVFLAKRMSAQDLIGYWVAQFIGATLGALVLYAIASGNPEYTLAKNGLGQDGFSTYSLGAAFLFEVVMTFIFVLVILMSTRSERISANYAGIIIALTLTLIHIVGIGVTGVSVNPARSFGPAIIVGGEALSQLWVFIVAPLAGGALAAFLHNFLDKPGA